MVTIVLPLILHRIPPHTRETTIHRSGKENHPCGNLIEAMFADLSSFGRSAARQLQATLSPAFKH